MGCDFINHIFYTRARATNFFAIPNRENWGFLFQKANFEISVKGNYICLVTRQNNKLVSGGNFFLKNLAQVFLRVLGEKTKNLNYYFVCEKKSKNNYYFLRPPSPLLSRLGHGIKKKKAGLFIGLLEKNQKLGVQKKIGESKQGAQF